MIASPARFARRAAWAAIPVAALASGSARAMDAEVTSDTAAQFYNVASPGLTVLTRRRLTTTLGASAYNLMDTPAGDPHAPELSFRARVRYDADYGASGDEHNAAQTGAFVPGFNTGAPGAVDVMYAYLEGRRFLHGALGFKIGRQYVTDALGWWSFDGGEVAVTTPYYVKAEAYGGLEERGGMPLSTSRFEAEGVWRGDRSGFDPSLYTAFQPAAIAPAYGVALESVGLTWLHTKLSYRRVYNTGSSNVSEFASGLYAPATYEGTRISTDKVGYTIDASWANVGSAKAGLVYDLYRVDVTNLYATVEGYLGRKVTVSADYDYYVPSFDADSIWNFFAGEPMNDVGLRANVDLTDKVSIAGGGRVKIFDVQTAPLDPGGSGYSPYTNFNAKAPADVYPTNGHPFDEGANLSARYRTGEMLVSLRGSGNWGGDGDRVGADVSAQRVFETRYVASVRTGLWQWDDKLRPDRDATSFNYVLGLGYRFMPRSQALVEFENDMNRLVGQRFRLMVWLTLATK